MSAPDSSPPSHLPQSVPAAVQAQAAQAKTWMKRGIALLSANTPDSLPKALRCFDAALQLRQDQAFEDSTWLRWLLTACWMNRGDVLTRLGSPQNLADAIRSFDEAIQHLEHLPLDEDPQYRGRLVLAWMNRALALRARATPESLNDALHSLLRSREVLNAGKHAPDLSLRASISLNLAALLLELPFPHPIDAMRETELLLEMCRPTEGTDALAAELGVKGRHAFCKAVAVLLETPPVDTSRADGWILLATDKVDEAMQLMAIWEKREASKGWMLLRNEFFRFGCHMYLAWQPHFLAEFLLDVLDPARGSPQHSDDQQLFNTAREVLTLAATEWRRRGPLDLGLRGMDRLLEVLEVLNAAGRRIENLAQQRQRNGQPQHVGMAGS